MLSELENRVDALSSSLATSRDETATLQQEVASLREQNSFLRGMLSVQGNGNGSAVDLPPAVSGPASHHGRPHPGGGGGGRGASAARAGASAVLGAVGTGLAVISCVALSAAGFGEGRGANYGGGGGGGSNPSYGGMGGVHTAGVDGHTAAYAARGAAIGYGGGGGSSMGGRRMLLSVDESADLSSSSSSLLEGGDTTGRLSSPGALLGEGVGDPVVYNYLLLGVWFALGLALVFVVARWAYRKATAHSSLSSLGVGGRERALRRDRRKGNGGARVGCLGGVWPLSGLRGGDGPVRRRA